MLIRDGWYILATNVGENLMTAANLFKLYVANTLELTQHRTRNIRVVLNGRVEKAWNIFGLD